MSLTVNTNVTALGVQRHVEASSSRLATSLQRLASGWRVGSAKEDAAGLAVAESFDSVIRGGRQAARNANDAVSFAQTAESALDQMTRNLQRIREISLQAANGSVSDRNRSQLQKEVDQLTQEISRTVGTTEFNGTLIFSGTSTVTFHIGFGGMDDSQVQISTTDLAQSLGNPSPAALASAAVATAVAGATSPRAAIQAADQALRSFIPTGLTVSAGVNTYSVSGFTTGTPAQNAAWNTYKAAEAAYNAGGVNARTILANMVGTSNNSAFSYGWINAGAGLYSYYQSLTATGTINITNPALAVASVGSVDSDLAKLADLRASFGAVQNRFQAVIASLHDHGENVSAARSRIMDADLAQEAAQLTRDRIVHQAGLAALSQANASPRAALALLRDSGSARYLDYRTT